MLGGAFRAVLLACQAGKPQGFFGFPVPGKRFRACLSCMTILPGAFGNVDPKRFERGPALRQRGSSLVARVRGSRSKEGA